jgi:hypothetical protein
MPCNCGKGVPKEAITSAAATALISGQGPTPTYETTYGDGSTESFDRYVDAKTAAVRKSGTVREVRG